MKPLQNYIEEEIKEFDKEFKDVPDMIFSRSLKEGGGHPNMNKIKFKQFLFQSLHRIAKITAEEIVPDLPTPPAFYKTSNEIGYDEGFRQSISDLQSKIKEFGI